MYLELLFQVLVALIHTNQNQYGNSKKKVPGAFAQVHFPILMLILWTDSISLNNIGLRNNLILLM